MAKFLIGLFTGLVLAILTGVLMIFSLARLGGEKRVAVSDGSTLILSLEGEIPERSPVEVPFFEGSSPVTVFDVWNTLRKAATDSRIKAIVLEPRGLAIGWAKTQEIRDAIVTFKKSGKPVIAYLKSPGTREYYLATAADKIYFSPEEFLNVKGLRAELTYIKKTLDKVGVEVEIEHAGKYKDFGDTFTRENMSPETREVYTSVLDDLYANLTRTIGAARKKTPAEIAQLIDQGPFLGTKAKEFGLVDGLLYEDQMFDELKSQLKSGDLKKVSHRDYLKISAASLNLEGGPKVAIVAGDGGITRGSAGDDGLDDDGITAEGFNKLLRKVSADDSIKAVLVRVDSPGGDAIASDEIWREMNLLSKKKPLVISMSDAAASGGYYMAMTGDTIVAQPGTITGSIGVVFGKANLRGLYDKIGLTKDFIERGRNAGIESDYQRLTPEARAKLREGIDSTYKAFVSKVAAARKRKYDDIEPLAQGRVWLGTQAKDRGLVDELGGIDRSLDLLRAKAKIGKDQKLTLVTYPPKRNILDVVFGRDTESIAETVARRTGIVKPWQVRLWSQGGMMRLMPYSLDIR